MAPEFTRDEAEWLSSAARRAAEDTVVAGASEHLRVLAEKVLSLPDHPDDEFKDALRRLEHLFLAPGGLTPAEMQAEGLRVIRAALGRPS